MMAFERHSLASDADLVGTVRVTCASTVADRLARSPLIERFRERHPGLRVELVITDRYLDLSNGEADIAIRAGDPRDDTPFSITLLRRLKRSERCCCDRPMVGEVKAVTMDPPRS
jgi:DNA-binding transcriptional LysR family regulator